MWQFERLFFYKHVTLGGANFNFGVVIILVWKNRNKKKKESGVCYCCTVDLHLVACVAKEPRQSFSLLTRSYCLLCSRATSSKKLLGRRGNLYKSCKKKRTTTNNKNNTIVHRHLPIYVGKTKQRGSSFPNCWCKREWQAEISRLVWLPHLLSCPLLIPLIRICCQHLLAATIPLHRSCKAE